MAKLIRELNDFFARRGWRGFKAELSHLMELFANIYSVNVKIAIESTTIGDMLIDFLQALGDSLSIVYLVTIWTVLNVL